MKYQHTVVIHNGEIYNYLELREELEKHGFHFQTSTDTEVLAAAYCQWGQDCVQHFNGIWAFAIYDAANNTVFCSRDRFGVKPFYFTQLAGKFCFASEIKQFTTISGWKPAMNLPLCLDFLQNGQHDRSSETLFEGVSQLTPGHNLVFDLNNNKYCIRRYYDLREQVEPSKKLSFEDAKTQFRELFFDAVRLQMRADVKVGLTLSGGLDSSSLSAAMIVFWKNKVRLEAFTASFREQGYDESPFAEAAAQKHQLLLHTYWPDADLLTDKLPTVTWHLDEPPLTPSDVVHFQLFAYAKTRDITVNLCGQGSDEILAGYDACYPPYWKGLLHRQPLRAISEILGFALHHPATVKKRLGRKRGNSQAVGIYEKVPSLTPLQNACLRFIESTVLPFILHSEDRLSMAHSIESRVPFLDHRLVEFCLSLPDGFKIKNGIRKQLLREAMQPELPEKVYRRTDKLGFETPLSIPLLKRLEEMRQALEQGGLPEGIGPYNGKTGLELWRRVAFLGWWEMFIGM
jgi:asparagine synthase (glutamine-hydrolysing)